MFLLDTAFSTFYNTPPRIVMGELKLDMPCSEACFQATSREMCFRLYQQWRSHMAGGKPSSLGSMVSTMCEATRSADDYVDRYPFSVLNLFTAVSGRFSRPSSPIHHRGFV